MKRQIRILLRGLFVLFGGLFLTCNPVQIKEYSQLDRLPTIAPEYIDTVIPPNIAPLNFVIKEPAKQYFVKISSLNGTAIEISSKNPKVDIPIKAWRRLLSQNKGQELKLEIYFLDLNDKWTKFKTITNRIAEEEIDKYLVYRLLHPASNLWSDMGIYQRNLETYDEEPVLTNKLTESNCMNCHHFCKNDPNKMVMHLRAGKAGGTLINRGGKVIRVNTSTEFNKAGAYPSWHPNGNLIAFSVNKLSMFFHTYGESRDVMDRYSDLIVYDVDKNMVTTSPGIASPDRMENFPCWSADGKYLYFCSANKFESYFGETEGGQDLLYENIDYDLKRIPYHVETDTWGEVETVLASSETGLSMTEPRVSPDGRYLLFTAAEYGNFPIYLISSDVYILDMETGEYFKPDINSDNTDSFHSWSSNGRWFVFISRRDDKMCARPYFSYFDGRGIAHKPFVLPQKNPEFYDDFLQAYNVPELIRDKITVKPQKLAHAAYGTTIKATLDPRVKMSKESKTEPTEKWQPAPQ
jgi:hypothetical protein